MTQVVIDDIIPRTQLVSSAGQTVFNTNWTANAASDVLVYARATGTAPNDFTQLVSTSDYNVTFIGGSQTVRVTFLSGRTLNDIITIARATPAERLNLYINTNFVPQMLNEDFGILTLVDQQAQMYDTVVAPRYNVSAVIEPQSILGGGDVVLPILPAGYGWRKNDANTAIEPFAIPSGGFAPAAAKYVLQEADSFLPNAFSLGTLTNGILKQTVAGSTATPAIALVDTDYYGPGMVGYMQYPRGIKDSNGNIIVRFDIGNAGADEFIVLNNGTFGDPASVTVDGTPADIQLNLISKGIGEVAFATQASADAFSFFSGTGYQHQTTFTFANTAQFRQVTWQDASGTVAYLSDVAGTVTSAEGTEFQVLVNGNFGTQETGDIVLTLPQDIAPSSSPTFAAVQTSAILDSNGVNVVVLGTAATAVNWITFANSATGGGPTIAPQGSDPNIPIAYITKGTGQHVLSSANTTTPLVINSGTGLQHTTNFIFANTSASRNVTFQDASGTVAFLTDIPAGSPSALTRTDDTNVTITLGGTPATALLQAVSLTMGWTGQLSLARGGSNKSLTASNGGIVYSDADSMEILAGTATALQMLQSGSSSAPAWSTTTWPATSTVNQLLYSSATNTIAGLATANNGILVTSAGGVPSIGNTVGAGLTMPSITFNSTSGIIGTTTNDAAAALSVGEYLTTSSNALATSVTTNTATDLLTLSLTAGDWDVWGTVTYFGNGATVVLLSDAWVSTASATRPVSEFRQSFVFGAAFTPYATGPISINAPMTRVSVASTTNVYLQAYSAFTTSTTTAGGAIYARRRR